MKTISSIQEVKTAAFSFKAISFDYGTPGTSRISVATFLDPDKLFEFVDYCEDMEWEVGDVIAGKIWKLEVITTGFVNISN
jgi:hypothetical protein